MKRLLKKTLIPFSVILAVLFFMQGGIRGDSAFVDYYVEGNAGMPGQG